MATNPDDDTYIEAPQAEGSGELNNDFEKAMADSATVQRHVDLFGMDDPQTTEDLLNAISPSGTLAALFGVAGQDARAEAAQAQLDLNAKALNTLLSDLAPYRQAGASLIPAATGLATSPEAQQAFLEEGGANQLLRGIARNSMMPALGGKAFSDELQTALDSSFMRQGGDLLDQQLNRMLPTLNLGQAAAAQTGTQGADLTADFGNILGAQTMADAQAAQQGTSNVVGSVVGIASMFSDERLKQNIEKVGDYNGLNVYTWDWKANDLGLSGSSYGHMASEVKEKHPELVGESQGYMTVTYGVNGKTIEVKNAH